MKDSCNTKGDKPFLTVCPPEFDTFLGFKAYSNFIRHTVSELAGAI